MKNLFDKLRNPKVLRILAVLLVVILVAGGYLFYLLSEGRVSIDNSLVQAPIISIAPTTPGIISQMNVWEGEKIAKGDTIAVVGGQPISADTDGLVIMANNQIGSIVSSANPVAQLIQPQYLRVAGTIDENKGLSDIKVGQVVSFTVDALPGQTFWGYVDEISPTAKQTQATFSISSERPTQQFVIYARFDASKYPAIKNGMSAKMTIYTNTK